ncbi:unnamed protein product, partial [Amoebophrya sp. A120]|eukprot:GSA120T00009803001.1
MGGRGGLNDYDDDFFEDEDNFKPDHGVVLDYANTVRNFNDEGEEIPKPSSYNLTEHLRADRKKRKLPRHRMLGPTTSLGKDAGKFSTTSTVWDHGGTYIKGLNPRLKLFGPKPNPKREQNLASIGELRKTVEHNQLRNTLGDLKQRSFLWQEEYRVANDITQTLDFIVRHGGPAQRKSRKAHRLEGFKTAAEIKKEKLDAMNNNSTQSTQAKEKKKTTHTKVVAAVQGIRHDIENAYENALDEGIISSSSSDAGGNQYEAQILPNMSKHEVMREAALASKRVSDRVAAPFGGYNLSMNVHRHHPLQDQVRKRELDSFRKIQWRKQAASNLEEHIMSRYCFGYSPYEDSRIWPSVRFRTHASTDKILRKTDELPDSLFMPDDSDSELEARAARRRKNKVGLSLYGTKKQVVVILIFIKFVVHFLQRSSRKAFVLDQTITRWRNFTHGVLYCCKFSNTTLSCTDFQTLTSSFSVSYPRRGGRARTWTLRRALL